MVLVSIATEKWSNDLVRNMDGIHVLLHHPLSIPNSRLNSRNDTTIIETSDHVEKQSTNGKVQFRERRDGGKR